MHDKGGVHGRVPWQTSGVTKAGKATGQPDGGLALLRWGVTHGDVRRAGVLVIAEMARPEASLARCSFIDCFMHENGNCSTGVIPCVLCRGGRDSFAEGNLARPGGLAKLRLVLGKIQGDTPGVPSRGEVPREGKNPREARQAWRAWSLAGSETASVMSSRGEVPREGKPSRGSPGLESLVLDEIF